MIAVGAKLRDKASGEVITVIAPRATDPDGDVRVRRKTAETTMPEQVIRQVVADGHVVMLEPA